MLDVPRTLYASEGDLRIAYQVVGEGPLDLVFAPGGQIPVDLIWEDPGGARFLRRLSSFSRMVLFDSRGWGASRTTTETAASTFETWADDLRLVMDTVGIERAAVVGFFSGAVFSIYFAATHPERVSSLVLLEGFARMLRDADYPAGMTETVLDNATRVYVEGYGSGRDVAYMAPSRARDERFQDWWGRCERLANGPAAAGLYWRELAARDLRAVLPTLQPPTLVLHRRGDRFIRVEHGRYLANHIQRAAYVELEGADFLFFASGCDRMLDEIEMFLTGVAGSQELDRVLAAVLFTDIVASTDTAAVLGDHRWRELLDRHDTFTRAQVGRFRGRVVKTTGDGVLATFDGPARAIQCACTLREEARTLGVELRSGIHTGEVERRGNDIGGIAVHIAARVQSIAKASEVIVSRTVADLVAGSGITFDDRGEHELKGIPGQWRLLAVREQSKNRLSDAELPG